MSEEARQEITNEMYYMADWVSQVRIAPGLVGLSPQVGDEE